VAMPSSVRSVLQPSESVHLQVEKLTVRYRVSRGSLAAVDGVSFEVRPGESLGLVGESGCGKSTVAKALLRLLPGNATVEGRIALDGEDILGMSSRELQRLRWTKIALITQSAMNALDPVYRVGDQIAESILAHEKVGKHAAWQRAEALFAMVGIAPERLRDYPHQFSGGMRQRAVIAMAMSLNAGLLIADEPTTALDSIMQDQILGRIRKLQDEYHRSLILVTHDMAVVAETCDKLAVMYAGVIIETGSTKDVLVEPYHPYTMGLVNAFPTLRGARRHLISIPGTLPSLLEPPPGCRFASRCPFSTAHCERVVPPLIEVGEGHFSACHYPDKAAQFRTAATEASLWSGSGRLDDEIVADEVVAE
jgi:peptide/nickel transport system ATP-binding protein